MTPRVSILTPVRAKEEMDLQWLHECIYSVMHQKVPAGMLEQIVVDDHSAVDLAGLRRHWRAPIAAGYLRFVDAEHQGVSAARNQAAELAQASLLLPVDGDDKLAASAVGMMLAAWEERGDAGIVYSDCVMFGQDYARVYLAPEYDFRTMLRATFMTVGCLHKREDWARVGGWRLDMTRGLEDWEYWISLGELGVCGKRLAEPLYWYRRHPRGRLQWLKANKKRWDQAYLAMRQLHIDSYDGRYPVGCCGGRRRSTAPKAASAAPAVATPVAAAAVPSTQLINMLYVGRRMGDFQVQAMPTRTRYHVCGAGNLVQMLDGRQGVRQQDVAWFRSVNQGRDFRVVEAPPMPVGGVLRQAPRQAQDDLRQPLRQAQDAPRMAQDASEQGDEAWTPDVMVEIDPPEPLLPDISAMTVSELRASYIYPEHVAALIEQEQEGRNRRTVIRFLEGLGDA